MLTKTFGVCFLSAVVAGVQVSQGWQNLDIPKAATASLNVSTSADSSMRIVYNAITDSEHRVDPPKLPGMSQGD